ncbi:MAG: exodeoxyribonuclease large subunit [Panacagrimonas sp.]|nr:exodeoxyribonuclease VII large subunit [Panacagrimonas sp.]MCC2655934.1 exodeoxyribonuclease large subunit [Panacagrimonas sp.]
MTEPPHRTVHTVSELAEILRALVEDSLPRLWVEGEISNLSKPASGHWYFTLKDARAQIRCAMFRNANYLVRPPPQNGDHVRVRAQASFYTARGDLQLICEYMEPAGEGALLRAFEELKKRLSAEGLFDPDLKRPVPSMPRRIGVITSATGAAIQDVRAALARRFPLLEVVLWPVPVQGAAAAPAIVKALRELPKRAPVDAVLLVRGGGSLEDLWAFNEEAVARAVRACTVPVVTGIGHEIDTTIADFAADLRAPTPTAAAELVTPDGRAFVARLQRLGDAATRAMTLGLSMSGERLARARGALQRLHPRRALEERAQRLDDHEQRLRAALLRRLRDGLQAQTALSQRLQARDPAQRLKLARVGLAQLGGRLNTALGAALRLRRAHWDRQQALLRSLSPQAVLDRGYAVARLRDADGGQVIRAPDDAPAEASFVLLLARGRLDVRRTGPD